MQRNCLRNRRYGHMDTEKTYGPVKSMRKVADWLKKRKNRIILSAAAGIMAAVLSAGGFRLPDTAAQAWWGSIYPDFCFARPLQTEEENKEKDQTAENKVKISFWLAKALDW